MPAEYVLHNLCGNCGSVRPDEAFEAVRQPGERTAAPDVRCPVCLHLFDDDDAGPCLYSGSRESMDAQRERLVWEDEADRCTEVSVIPPIEQEWAERVAEAATSGAEDKR